LTIFLYGMVKSGIVNSQFGYGIFNIVPY